MKKAKTFCAVAAAVCTLACLAGCGNKKIEAKPIPSDTLYVEKVENLPEDFILGMDSSQVPALEAAGVKYYDFDGNERKGNARITIILNAGKDTVEITDELYADIKKNAKAETVCILDDSGHQKENPHRYS